MGIFTRRINKKAQNQPEVVHDFYPSSSFFDKKDGTAFACVDRIASQFAMLNYGIYDAKTKQKIKRHPLYSVLKEPNLSERHFNFFYQSVKDYYNGGVFWLKAKYDGEVVSLFRLNPSAVVVDMDATTRQRIFRYNGKIFTQDDILYIPSRFDYNPLIGGASIYTAAKDVFDTSATLETFTQKSFAQGIVGKRTVIDISQALPDATAEQLKKLKDNFQAEYSGVENAGRPLIKKKGIEYSELGSSGDNRAAELSENRKIQEHDICKIFAYPQSLLSPSGNTNLETEFTLALTFAIQPLATQFQEIINSMLDEDRFYFEFDYNGVMKVSLQQRIDAYQKQINNGLMNPDEARAKENMPPLPDGAGQNYFMPVNMMPLNKDTIASYMAKQKKEMQNLNDSNPTDENAQHFLGGDDKQ